MAHNDRPMEGIRLSYTAKLHIAAPVPKGYRNDAVCDKHITLRCVIRQTTSHIAVRYIKVSVYYI